jgi:hypothetical protein
MIPATIWKVFSTGWLDITKAPADAPHWLEQGYLLLVHQGKLTGYVIALPGYRLVMGRENHEPR